MKLDRFVIFFFLTVCGVYAQNQKRLMGSVSVEDVELSNITVQNLSKKSGVVTNQYGDFELLVSIGDTLRITSVQIKPKMIVVDADVFRATRLRIPLEPFVNELDGVTLNPYGLSRALTEDLDRLSVNKQLDAEQLGLPNADAPQLTQSQRLLYEATSGGGFIPLNPLLNALSGRTKMLKNRIALEAKNNAIDQVVKRYEKPLFEDYLALNTTQILRFLYFIETDSTYTQLLAVRDELKFLEFMKKKSREFKQLEE